MASLSRTASRFGALRPLGLITAAVTIALGFLTGSGCTRPSRRGGPPPEAARSRRAEAPDPEAALAQVRAALRECQVRFGRLPSNLVELVRFRLLDEIPAPPEGMTYYYDPVWGNVQLAPLPPEGGSAAAAR